LSLLLGVDAGNTKTVALAAASDGRLLAAGWAGCGDLHARPVEAALDEVAFACRSALAAAGAPAEVAAACFSLAGADWPEDFAAADAGLTARLGLAGAPLVVNDAIGAIRAGTPDGVGVAVVCGTYGAPGARNARGDVFHVGFWPDATGGRPLGGEGLDAVWRAGLGTGPATSLTARALAEYGASDPLEVMHAFTRRQAPLPPEARDRLAAAVLDEAEAGDAVARGIVERQGRVLGDQARTCASRVGLLGAPYPVVLGGGVFRHPSRLLAEGVLARLPAGRPVEAPAEPVVGALLLAFDRAGVGVEEDALRTGAAALLARR
jgi:N-acetylglucosamine kinase-like BadF-type ATPase